MSGQSFGMLTVLEQAPAKKDGHAAWLCRCDCGNELSVSGRNLRSGITRSCGCLRRRQRPGVDISGKVYGLLTAIAPTQKREKGGSIIWLCRCDCGNDIEVSQGSLCGGNKRSCGCLQRENRKNINKTLHREDGTCVESLGMKMRVDNTSGFTGVSRMSSGRYRATIGFKGKNYHLGYFSDVNEAAQARKEASKMHDNFLREFYSKSS